MIQLLATSAQITLCVLDQAPTSSTKMLDINRVCFFRSDEFVGRKSCKRGKMGCWGVDCHIAWAKGFKLPSN